MKYISNNNVRQSGLQAPTLYVKIGDYQVPKRIVAWLLFLIPLRNMPNFKIKMGSLGPWGG